MSRTKANPSRQLRRYYRRKAGRMSLHLEIDPEGVAGCLRSIGVSVWTVDKPSLRAGLESFLEAWELGGFIVRVYRDGEE